LTYRSKQDFVYTTLRQKILTGELPPGSRLVIGDLATVLGVSHIPVREALQRLSADGYAVTRPYLGTHVTELKAESVRELFQVMAALELISVRLALPRFGAEEVSALEQRLRAMDGLVADPDAWSHANIALHVWLCEKADAALVMSLLTRAFDHWDRLRRFYFAPVFQKRIGAAQREHWLMFEAFKAGDAEKLVAAVHTHNEAATRAYIEHLERVLVYG